MVRYEVFPSIEPDETFRLTMSPNGKYIKIQFQDGTEWITDSIADRLL
jgi:hypothetical protein